MRTWLAKAVSERRQLAHFFTRTVAATIAVLTLGSISALAQSAHEVGRRSQLEASRSLASTIPRHRRPSPADDRHPVLHLRTGFRPHHLHPPAQDAGASFHARDLRADLRDLQDLPGHPGQVPADPVALHRRHHRALLRLAVAGTRTSRSRSPCPSFCCSAWSESRAATAWRGSASASTPSPTRAPLSPDCAASRIRSTTFR